MKKFKLVLFLLLFSYLECEAQSFYVSSPGNFNTFPLKNNIYRVTKTPAGFQSELINTCFNSQYFSIAMNSSDFYWIENGFYFQGRISGNSLVACQQVAPIPSISNALTIGTDGKLYQVPGVLLITDPATGQTINKGKMNYFPSGDMTFYKDDLYMAATQGLVKVDTNTPSQSYVYMPWSNTLNIFGLVCVETHLHRNTVYALSAVNGSTNIIEIDIENKIILGVVGSLPYSVLDAASIVEDGSIRGILIDKINLRQDCDEPLNGIVEVITKAHLDPFTYQLSNGSSNTTGVFTGVAPGTYQLTITSAQDIITSSVTVPVYDLAKPDYSYTVKNQVCDIPGEVKFTSAMPGAYKVKLGATAFLLNHTFEGLTSAGSHHFSILNESGCEVDAGDIIIPRDICEIELEPAVVQKECNAINKGSIKVLTKPHADIYTYTLDGNSNTTGVFTMLDPGDYTITITSPEDAEVLNVSVPDYRGLKPVLTVSKTNPVCDQKGEVKFSSTNSSLYKVRLGSDIYPLSHSFTGLNAGLHSFVILDQQNCMLDIRDVLLTQVKCTIKFDRLEVQQQCDALHKGMVSVLTNPHSDQYTYTLNGISNTTGIFNNLNAGSYVVRISSAEDELEMDVTVPDYKLSTPVITYITNNPVCPVKGDIKFSTLQSSLYKIKHGTVIYPFDHLFTDLSAGSYSFTVLTQSGCIVDEFTLALDYQACPVVIDNIIIAADCATFGQGTVQVVCPPIPETYSYTLNNNTNVTGVFNSLDPGTYRLTVNASGGNSSSRDVVVPDFRLNKPFTTIKKTDPVCDILGQIAFTVGSDPDQYNIKYKSLIYPSDYIFSDLYAGAYSFTILKKDGCIVDEIDLTLVQEQCSPVSFPSAFTPNNDGINDIFRANPESKGSNFVLQIYNRWGRLVFTSMNLHDGWNGEFNGSPVPVSTYYWVASFSTQENKTVVQKGYVTLMR